ncbi:hypothetical protein [Pseudaminobacter soli (ex Li et al. 2025)]|uniref:hypothetical protein n=1 Tax=Pseudaminobacter soli (ex Li et al. 2025) TaxID=1295366 RepID=UPI0015E6CC31|nr:hypothetical protein [Mesorhizobium soli]
MRDTANCVPATMPITTTVYANVGYAWKKLDASSPPYNALSGDKINVTAGYKHSF